MSHLIVNHRGYNEIRNIITPFEDKLKVFRRRGLVYFLFALFFKITNKPNQFLRNTAISFFSKDAIFHMFNGVLIAPVWCKWVVTFETTLPRWGSENKFLKYFVYFLLSRKNCLGIIAISSHTKDIFINDLLSNNSKHRSCILKKLVVLHPSQKKLINKDRIIDKFKNIETLNIVFVGNQFFRKGGELLLDAFIKIQSNKNLNLYIISKLETDSFVTFTNEVDVLRVKEKIGSNKNIRLLENIPNSDVLSILSKSHLCALPSYQDTYGYSILESQAMGTPVITTKQRAFSEINNNSCGWLLDEPSVNMMHSALLEAIGDHDVLLQKALAAYHRVVTEHSLLDRRDVLNKVYRDVE